jgi:hypothetical protein
MAQNATVYRSSVVTHAHRLQAGAGAEGQVKGAAAGYAAGMRDYSA